MVVTGDKAFHWHYWQLRDGRIEELEEPIAAEEPLRIEVNGHEVATLMRSPGQEKELAIGFCLGEGLIHEFKAIRLVHFCGSVSPFEDVGGIEVGNRVEIRVDESAWQPHPPGEAGRLVRSGCAAVALPDLDLELSALTDDSQVPLSVLLGLRRSLQQTQVAYSLYGGVHAAAVFDREGHVLALGEDVGRHNAVDKAVGACLIQGIPLNDKILLSTGRASYDMVAKAVRMGIPIVVSISSPTSLAVRLAELYHCTLLGYLRSRGLRLYAWPERILWPAGVTPVPVAFQTEADCFSGQG